MTMTMIAAAASQKRSDRPFIIKVNHTAGFTVTLPLVTGYNYNFIVDWGDGAVGQVTTYNDADATHIYSGAGTYTITMTGALEGWSIANGALKAYLVEVVQMGRTGFKYLVNGFNGCYRLTSVSGAPYFATTNISLEALFKSCTSLTNADVANWDMSKISSVHGMFTSCTVLTTIDVLNWDVSNITRFGYSWMYGLFEGCTALTSIDISNWTLNTSANVEFYRVFYNCTNLTTVGTTTNLINNKVVKLDNAFYGCAKLVSLDVSGWDTSNVTSISGTFYNCNKLTTLNVSNWDTTNITNYNSAFHSCTGLTTLDVSGWNVTKGTDFTSIFQSCTGLTTIDVSSWVLNTTNTINFASAFIACTGLTSLSTGSWNTSKVSNFYTTFKNCSNLVTIDVSGWNLISCTYLTGTFSGCSKISALDVSNWNVSNVTSFGIWHIGGTFEGCTALTSLSVGNWSFNTVNAVAATRMFYGCTGLTTLDVASDGTSWNTGKFSAIDGLFANCTGLTTLDVSNWDTTNITNYNSAFLSCTGLTTLDVSSWNVTKGTNFYGIFKNIRVATLNVNNWVLNDTSAVTLSEMFVSNPNLTSLNLAAWNVSKVTSLDLFVASCTSLTTIGDTSSWVTTSLTSILAMFNNCVLLTNVYVNGFDVSKVTKFGYYYNYGMFENCYSLTTIDVSSWVLNTISDVETSRMFRNCTALTSIDISGWNMTKVVRNDSMFYGCSSLASITIPSTLSIIGPEFVQGCSNIVTYNFYRTTSPTINGTPFSNYNTSDNVKLHVPTGSTSYNTAPWTTDAIFDQPISFDL